MKKILTAAICLMATSAFSQIPEDALRYSFQPISGTARTMAIGGAMGSLGGDITVQYVNPAGLGLFRTNEFAITGSWLNNDAKFNYKGNELAVSQTKLNLGPTGAIFGKMNDRRTNKSSAFAISINKTADFNKVYNYMGYNISSSYAEQFAEEFANSGLSINQALNTMSSVPYTVAPALYTYLIDTVTVNGQTIVKAAPEYVLSEGKALLQQMNKTTTGGQYEIALSGAYNDGNKWLLGATLGIPFTVYKSNTQFYEADTSASTTNMFNNFTYYDAFKTTGVGLNAKLGAIYRPKEYVRLGLAVHTPSMMMLNDVHESNLTTKLEPAQAIESVSSNEFTNGIKGESRYMQSTPWKFILSGSYVFREVQDIARQKGFITADIEYVTHGSGKFHSQNEEPTAEEKAYYKELSRVINDQYDGAFNFRLGGELKFKTIMARLGAAYYSNPYHNEQFKASITNLSGGLGYRNKGMFIDLTYVYSIRKDGVYPYRLSGIVNDFAKEKANVGNIVATVGFKF